MKKIKVTYLGQRLKDIYPHATRFQVLRWRFNRFMSKVIIIGGFIGYVASAYMIGQMGNPEPVLAQTDTFNSRVETLKNEVVEKLAGCEANGFTSDDAPIILDSNKEISLGRWMYQRDTVIYYVKKLYGQDITRKEAVLIALDDEKGASLTKDILFKEANGYKNWAICSKKLGLVNQIEIINKLEN